MIRGKEWSGGHPKRTRREPKIIMQSKRQRSQQNTSYRGSMKYRTYVGIKVKEPAGVPTRATNGLKGTINGVR